MSERDDFVMLALKTWDDHVQSLKRDRERTERVLRGFGRVVDAILAYQAARRSAVRHADGEKN